MDGFVGEFDAQAADIALALAPIDLSGWTLPIVGLAVVALIALALTDAFTPAKGPRR